MSALVFAASPPKDTPSHYEALQLVTSTVHRNLKLGHVTSALDNCYNGVLSLLKYKRVEIASQLSMFYLDCLTDTRTRADEGTLHRILTVHKAYISSYQAGSDASVKQAQFHIDFLKAAIKWSDSLGEILLGSFELHKALAEVLWSAKQYSRSVLHFSLAECPTELVAKLCTVNDDYERDALLCLAGCNFMACENMRDASKMFIRYRLNYGKGAKYDGVKPTRPATFICWLIEICKRGSPSGSSVKLFNWVLHQFDDLQQKERTLTPLLQKIGRVYFDMKPPPNMMNMLESMLGVG